MRRLAQHFCAHIPGISQPEIETNRAAYLQNWIAVLKGILALILCAAAQAQHAADIILGTPKAEKSQAQTGQYPAIKCNRRSFVRNLLQRFAGPGIPHGAFLCHGRHHRKDDRHSHILGLSSIKLSRCRCTNMSTKYRVIISMQKLVKLY